MNRRRSRIVPVVFVVAFVLVSAPALASETDDRIQSSAENSYVFNNYLKGDTIKIESKDGAVTLRGTVAKEPHKALALEVLWSLPGVKSVDNRLEFKVVPPPKVRMRSSSVRE